MKSLLLLVVAMVSIQAAANPNNVNPVAEGWETGNPGDATAEEFQRTARHLLIRLKMLPVTELAPVDLVLLEGLIANVKLESKPRLYDPADGKTEVEALNYPVARKIEINRSIWIRKYSKAGFTRSRYGLVLHEYLGIMGLEVRHYDLSRRLMSLVDVGDYGTKVFWNPINPVNYVSMDLVYTGNPDCKIKGLKFDLEKEQEILTTESLPKEACGADYRRVVVKKMRSRLPGNSDVRGMFDNYFIEVYDREGNSIDPGQWQPQYGNCKLPLDQTCRSGKMFEGGVELEFWLLPE